MRESSWLVGTLDGVAELNRRSLRLKPSNDAYRRAVARLTWEALSDTDSIAGRTETSHPRHDADSSRVLRVCGCVMCLEGGGVLASVNSESLTARELQRARRTGELRLSHRMLTALPPEICQLANLQTLDLSGNKLTVLPPEIGQLANLQILHLIGNELKVLPPEIGQLADLQVLDLSGNKLTELPPEIGQLADLEALWLNGNKLKVLPPEIGQLAYLETLWLNGNELTALPPEIGQLAYLETLNLDNNKLTTLPPQIGRLLIKGLSLSLHDNPMRGRIRKLSGRALGVYLRRLDPIGRQTATFDGWSSEDWRILIITIFGSFAANIVTLLFGGLAVVFLRGSKIGTLNGVIITAFLSLLAASLVGYSRSVPHGLRRSLFFRIIILLAGFVIFEIALIWVGKASGIK
jgi:Leucine rich repeat/Leucine Rich Repeat